MTRVSETCVLLASFFFIRALLLCSPCYSVLSNLVCGFVHICVIASMFLVYGNLYCNDITFELDGVNAARAPPF
ncbi:hypothetical protein V1517DRAFT_325907 [Lipomyces orientalis]|uniref:Uncharacterized protein n=1 Tax=Lipomyces orientalis TaxID=1233043 RepID=A0ACC3TKU5_9ASCO